MPVYVSETDAAARAEAKAHFEAFRNVYVRMPLDAAAAYTSRDSLKNVMKAKAQMFGDVTLDQAIELGLFVCGSTATVRTTLERYWSDMRLATCWSCASSARYPASSRAETWSVSRAR